MTHPNHLIEYLDWETIQCQCHVHPCSGRATRIVECHAVNHCDDQGLNGDGNKIQLLCDECLNKLRAHVGESLRRLHALYWGAEFGCGTCGAPIAEVADVVRAVDVL